MFLPDPLETVRSMSQLFHVRLHLFKQPYERVEELDFHLRQNLFENYDYNSLIVSLKSDLKQGTTYSECDVFDNWYCVFTLSTEGEVEPPPYEFAVLGPYRYKTCNEEDAEMYLQKTGLPMSLKCEFLYAIQRVPLIENRSFWVNMQIALIAPLITRDGNLKYRTLMDAPGELTEYKPANKSNEDYRRLSLTDGYALEQKLTDAVKNNQVGLANLVGYKYLNFQIQFHRQYGLHPTHALSALNIMLRHAVLEAGVNALRLDDIYVRYEKRFLQDSDQLLSQIGCAEIVSDYCKLVEQYAYTRFNESVRQTLDYIDFHFSEDISLHMLAEKLNISDGYLSASFHKETGVTVTAYIQSVRIKNACIQLETTDLSVQQIGLNCGFTDASYFTKIFKREKGVSPLQYRTRWKML